MAPPPKATPPPFRDVLARRGTTAKPPPPFGGTPPYQGDNGNKPPFGTYSPEGEPFPFPIGKQGDPEGGELFAPLIRGDQGGFSSRQGSRAAPPNKQNPLPPSGVSPLSGGQRQQTSLIRGGLLPDREARRPRRGRAFCPPDKGGLRGGVFPTGKQWDSPTKSNPSPFSGRTRPKGDNSKTPSPLRGYPPYQGDNGNKPP